MTGYKQFGGRFAGFHAVLALFSILASSHTTFSETVRRGSITGTVAANQGEVRGFRVRAHNLAGKFWYVVFTQSGHYTIPQVLPGNYAVQVEQLGYDSPTQTVEVKDGQSVTLNFVVKKAPPDDITYVDYDQLYPPGPGRDLIENDCMGCHGLDFYNRQHRNQFGWRAGFMRMTNGPFFAAGASPALGRTQLSARDRDNIVNYLAANFGPDSLDRSLMRDPLGVDESVVSKAIYVEYDAPQPQLPPGALIKSQLFEQFHDPYIAPPDRTIWFTAAGWNSMVHLDPREQDAEKRWKIYPVDTTESTGLHGLSVDSKGTVYFCEIYGGKVGILDPETGKVQQFKAPTSSSILQVVLDEPKGLLWYGAYGGNTVGVLDLESKKVRQWPVPTDDADPYGMALDSKGNVWVAGIAKGLVIKFDPVEQAFTEYQPPTLRSGVRRISVDSKGTIWFSEFRSGQIGSVNPATGQIKEYKLPLRFTHPYEIWPDRDDNLWITDQFYASLIKFDPKTQKFTYYPESQPTMNVPKVEVEPNNTIWSGSRGAKSWVAIHFYPNGYTQDAPPEP